MPTSEQNGVRAKQARAPKPHQLKAPGEKNPRPRELTPEERARLALKIEVARDLGLWEKVQEVGWGGLTAAESGRVGGVMTRRERLGRAELES
jgi:hypothetical protein